MVHLIVTILIYIVDRKHRRKHSKAPAKPVQDAVRDTLLEHYKKISVHPVIPLLLLSIPIYMMITNNAQLFEQTLVMYIMFLLVRTIQIILNKNDRMLIEYTNPIVTLVLLMLTYNKIIPVNNMGMVYLYVMLYNTVVLMAQPHKTSSSSLLDDTLLSHLIFYILK